MKTRMSKNFVIGVDHFLQNVESVCGTPNGKEWETKQKQALRARLEELIATHRPQLVAEEAKLDRDCIGKQIADSHGCNYCNLTMSWEDRSKAGITKDYDRTAETRSTAYRIFEIFMVERVQRCRGDADRILVICGSYHVTGVVELFRAAGDDVESEDTYEAEWYRGIPLESDGKMDGFYKEIYGRASN
jgi:hypothetical protein